MSAELIKKTRFKQELPVWVLAAPAEVLALLEGFDIKKKLLAISAVSQVLFCAKDSKALMGQLPAIKSSLAPDAIFWVAYPKKSGNIQSDLVGNDAWKVVEEMGFMGTASISIDDNWSGMRFKQKDPNVQYKRDVPMEERRTEGVDYVNRTVKLTDDAANALKGHSGLEEFFYAMSFSYKREYAEAIAEAKKPETRQRRIEKMVEMVLKMKTEKEKKKK